MHTSIRLPWRWVALAASLAALTGCQGESAGIVAGSSLVACAVHDVVGDAYPVHVLIPGGMCPGHFDMAPADVRAAASGALVLIQPWQQTLPNVRGLLEAAGVGDDRLVAANVPGNWMVPDLYAQAVIAVAGALCGAGLGERDALTERAQRRAGEVRGLGAEQRAVLRNAGAGNARVLCNEQQAPFAEWCGLNVVAAFGRPEELSAADIAELVERGKAQGAILVIDNLQSGQTKTGALLAAETGARHVVLSNFPGGLPGTDTYDAALLYNVRQLVQALEAGQPDAPV